MQGEGDSVKIDLVIGDETDPTGQDLDAETASEVICLRILSNRTRFRFGGMELTVKSPAFEIGKTFSVSLDENNRLAGIESFREYPLIPTHQRDGSTSPRRSPSPGRESHSSSRRVSLVNSLGLKPARIIVNPSEETEINEGLPLLSARLALEEDATVLPSRGLPLFGSRSKKKGGFVTNNNTSPRNGSPSPVGRSPSPSLTPLASPFRRTPSPSRISKLIGIECECDDTENTGNKKFVSIGVGTTSSQREDLCFDLQQTLRRSRSWKK